MWYYLRARRFEGRKFRRQVPLGSYIVDFLCEHAGLIVEVDGGSTMSNAPTILPARRGSRLRGIA